MKQTIWYFPLESVKSRYTTQLCGSWIPDAIKKNKPKDYSFKVIEGHTKQTDIKVGQVLDATGRGIYSLTQVAHFLDEVDKGNVKDNDILYIQDYWTPGIEAIQYALDLYKIKLKVYSMLHAQTVDKYDFTYPMREWMRPIEISYDRIHKYGGIFVGSTIHKKQLQQAGFKSPIHVVSLPISYEEVWNRVKDNSFNTLNAVVFSSRLDNEKNPFFMLKVAKAFLDKYEDWKFFVTTSSKQIRSNNPNVIKAVRKLAEENDRFIVLENLSKDDYYRVLSRCKIQLNTSLQDYVSWTLLEATICNCDICYPDYRSFPEIIPKDRRYKVWSVESALSVLDDCIKNPRTHKSIALKSDKGRLLEGKIICLGSKREVNIWSDKK
jgi:glycosyltransferase involved in cell wall biosynthesis